MSLTIYDKDLKDMLIQERQEKGLDRYDEVWEGDYIIMPNPNNEHQELVYALGIPFYFTISQPQLGSVFPGVNISDRIDDWQSNYRIPDLCVFLNDTLATNHGSFWHGGPDFAIEITSPDDRTRDKLDFYAAVGTGELLIIDREPWSLGLHRLEREVMNCVGRCEPGDERVLTSEVVPLTWQLKVGDPRPAILVTHHDGTTKWTV